MVGPPGSRGRNFPRVGILPRLFDGRGDQGKPRPLSGGPKKFGLSRPSTNSVFKFIRTAGVASPQSSEVLICVSVCRGLLRNFFQFYLHMEGGWPSERYALKVKWFVSVHRGAIQSNYTQVSHAFFTVSSIYHDVRIHMTPHSSLPPPPLPLGTEG